ncbi:hypothetical protein lerEdw1_008173 [Lerista edwardsae]|nr:hypothetical protein lerEdw1_008173 [Lerista edwardsae]
MTEITGEVMSVDEKENVGRISKQWTGFVKEAFTDADNFGIQFPMNLDVKMKAVMLGACFLIDFMFFEHTGQNRNQRAGVWAASTPGPSKICHPREPFSTWYNKKELVSQVAGASKPIMNPNPPVLPGTVWVPPLPLVPDCPRGLEYLTQVNQILIHQHIEFLEILQLEVHAPPGTPIGYVKQIWDPCVPIFAVQNEARKDILKITGPIVGCGYCTDVRFHAMSLDEGHTIGRIMKHCEGLVKECCIDADSFCVQFPLDLDVKMKAVMIGACFLIDFMFFEDGEPVCSSRPGVYHSAPLPLPPGTVLMPALPPIPGCPPGLEYLALVSLFVLILDQVVIHQQLEILECMYLFKLFEIFCLEVHAPPGIPIGYVVQTWDPCVPVFAIKNEDGQNVLKVIGPFVACGCCSDVPFDVLSLDEEHLVGKITKHPAGFVKEVFTDIDHFAVYFPKDLDAKIKAVLIGACFLIDYMFFEDTEPICEMTLAVDAKERMANGVCVRKIKHHQPAKTSAPIPTPSGHGVHVFSSPYVQDSGASEPGISHVPPILMPPGGVWMPPLPAIPNCPPGLEYLTQIDQLKIEQQLEVLECRFLVYFFGTDEVRAKKLFLYSISVITGCETDNKYEIKNAWGQRIFFAAEKNDFCTRNCCGPCRPFTLGIFDNLGQHIIGLIRTLRCCKCCCPCCLQEIEVHAPPGIPIGYVKQIWHPCLPAFVLQDEARKDVLKIIGPCVVCSCGQDVNFDVLSLNEQQFIGRIAKHWSDCMTEYFTDIDNFGIQFPVDLDVKLKAVMLGACFLIDFMFFDSCVCHIGEACCVWT